MQWTETEKEKIHESKVFNSRVISRNLQQDKVFVKEVKVGRKKGLIFCRFVIWQIFTSVTKGRIVGRK